MPNDLPSSLLPEALPSLPKARRTPMETSTSRALWPTFMRRTLPVDQVEGGICPKPTETDVVIA